MMRTGIVLNLHLHPHPHLHPRPKPPPPIVLCTILEMKYSLILRSDRCAMRWCACRFNIVMLWVIKYGSGVLYFISTAAVIPIVSLVSTTTWYSSLGLKALAFSAWQVVGLVVVVVGCGLYVYFLRREASPERIRARSLKDLARDDSEDDPFFLSKQDQLDDPIIDDVCFEEEWGDTFDPEQHPFDPDEDYGPYLPPPDRVNE